MKKIIGLICFLTVAFAVYGAGIIEDTKLADEKARTSYAFGQILGADLKQTGIDFDYNAFTDGVRESIEGTTRITQEEAVELVQTAFRKAMDIKAEENRAAEALFLTGNSSKAGIITTESGLQYEVLVQGTGNKPQGNDIVKVNYEGTLVDGTLFDSTWERGESAEIPISNVIPGWTEGLTLMNTGSTYRFYIPSELGYGAQGAGQVIPPYATLIFKVELLDILPQENNN